MAAKKKTTKKAKNEVMAPNDYGDYSGDGWGDTDNDHFTMPFLNQLQSLSPEIADPEQKVDGAEIGMFVNSVSKQLYGEVIFVPVAIKHSFVEWAPRESGGGFIAEHDVTSPVVTEAKQAAAGDLRKLCTPKKNPLLETFTVFAVTLDEVDSEEPSEPVVISFSKTKIKRYKKGLSKIRTCKHARGAPLYAHRIRMISTSEKNPAGQPYQNVELVPAIDENVLRSMIPTSNPLLAHCKALRASITEGRAEVNYETASQEAPAGSGDESDGHF